MSEKSGNHQEQEASPQLSPAQEVQAQGPVSEQTSPTAAAQRAISTPPIARQPSDYLALQKTVGNRAVQRIVESSDGAVQREYRDDPGFQSWRGQMRGALQGLQTSLQGVDDQHNSETEAINSSGGQWASMASVWNQSSGGGGGSGGGSGSPAGEQAAQESQE